MSDLIAALEDYGLFCSHSLVLTDQDKSAGHFQATEDRVLLVGNRGSSYWKVFSESPELADGLADPLDRWSKRVAQTVLENNQGFRAVFPSDGPPYLPFQRWAMAAGSYQQSPMGLLIHPDYGLWHSFRFALIFNQQNDPVGPDEAGQLAVACDNCVSRPCLNTCPVNAFTEQGFDVSTCRDYLTKTPSVSCHQNGCEARNACPAGADYRYQTEQHVFHFRAFTSAS